MSYDVHSETRPANEEKITTSAHSLWQKHAIALVALIEFAAMMALAVLEGMKTTSPKDRFKMIDQSQIRRKRDYPASRGARRNFFRGGGKRRMHYPLDKIKPYNCNQDFA